MVLLLLLSAFCFLLSSMVLLEKGSSMVLTINYGYDHSRGEIFWFQANRSTDNF
jgi:hypothetical protein